jgi:1-acyl-sn-glycerol-3-phosphate acyltransferase
MWREEPRPRPLKDGAFHYAVKHNVPVVPLFITFTPKEKMIDEQNRQEFSNYTIHILPPIYKKAELNNKENVEYMKNENYKLWAQTYENTYNKKLEFNIESKNQ